MALLVCLAVIAVLSAAGLELGKRVGRSTELTAVLGDRFAVQEMAMAGVHLAMVILEQDANKNETDSVQETWADPLLLEQAVAALGYTSGKITLSIVDELGKIQVNAILSEFPGNAFNNDQKMLWERLLDLMISADKSEDERDPAEIINSLKDWLDSGDDDLETGTSGAESAYYQTLQPPYTCANAPFDLLDELFLIKGLSKGLGASEAIPLLDNMDMDLMLEQNFTVFGMDDQLVEKNRYRFPGTININTANAMVLMALLPSGMEDQAQELVDFRAQKQQDEGDFVNALDKGWYKTVVDLTEKEEKQFERLIRYSSTVFKVECSAAIGTRTGSATAIVLREKDKETNRWICRIIRLTRDK
jgi:general secretion pathway protein K